MPVRECRYVPVLPELAKDKANYETLRIPILLSYLLSMLRTVSGSNLFITSGRVCPFCIGH